jgi:glycerophosphoryl diester phosphodiesterase
MADPSRRVHPFLDHPTPIPFVHRGGPTAAPENTLIAFERAYALGFRYFETDVHATADGYLVAFHDRSLRRLAGDRALISSLTADEVAAVRIDGQPVPRLEELLNCYPDARVNIDPKTDAAVRPLVSLLRERHSVDRVCLASFSDRRLRWLRAALGSAACTAAGPREIAATLWAVRRRRRDAAQRFPVTWSVVFSQLGRRHDARLKSLDGAELGGAKPVALPQCDVGGEPMTY